MESENIVLTQADYLRLMGDLSLLFDAVRELSGTISSYESAGFISEENITEATVQTVHSFYQVLLRNTLLQVTMTEREHIFQNIIIQECRIRPN